MSCQMIPKAGCWTPGDVIAACSMVAQCRGPASAGSRGTLRMNGVGERKRERERETRQGVQQSLANLYFLPQLLYSKLVHF